VPGRLPNHGFREGSGAVFRDKVPEEGSGGFSVVPERIDNDLVAHGGTGFRDGSLGEPVAVALVPALVLI